MPLILMPFVLSTAFWTVGRLAGIVAYGSTILVVDQYQRRKGYKPGEGVWTPRYPDFHGLLITLGSPNPLANDIAVMGHMFPQQLGRFIDERCLNPNTDARTIRVRMEMTESEGQYLRACAMPSIVAQENFRNSPIPELFAQNPEDEELQAIIMAHTRNMMVQLDPLMVFFQQFPRKRIQIE